MSGLTIRDLRQLVYVLAVGSLIEYSFSRNWGIYHCAGIAATTMMCVSLLLRRLAMEIEAQSAKGQALVGCAFLLLFWRIIDERDAEHRCKANFIATR